MALHQPHRHSALGKFLAIDTTPAKDTPILAVIDGVQFPWQR